MLKKVNTATLLVVLVSASLGSAQNAATHSLVGVWNLDLKQSKSDSEPPPKSATITIFTDTPDALAWRYEGVDAKGQSVTFSWSGPPDGSLRDVKNGDGQGVGKESLKREGEVVIRHGEVPNGQTFDGRLTISADGNTFTAVDTTKTQDGKTSTTSAVYHRVPGGKPASPPPNPNWPTKERPGNPSGPDRGKGIASPERIAPP